MASQMWLPSEQQQEQCFINTTSNSSREKNTTEEKMKLVQAVARLIKEDIKSITMTHDVYPSCDDLRSQEAGTEFLPDSLKELIIPGQNTGVKVASIGQAIVQAARFKVLLTPLQLGLGVQQFVVASGGGGFVLFLRNNLCKRTFHWSIKFGIKNN